MAVVGVVLAGGAGRRIGGDKATVTLDGEALLLRPLRALAAVTAEQAVVAKRGTRLPELPPGVAVWLEPDAPQHPLTGVRHALGAAGGRPVLCCAVDLPRLDAATLSRLLDADDGRHACVVPQVDGRLQPLCALWRSGALERLSAITGEPSMRDVVAALDPLVVAFADPAPFTNVNTLEELRALGTP